MQLRLWMLDVAREQSPTLDHLYRYASITLDAGYNALGLYFEHRFAYPSAPWVAGKGAVTPAMVRALRSEFPSLQLVPFINLLGHFEGFLYTEQGKRYREELFSGMQANPADPAFVEFCGQLVDDTLEIFDSELIHIGGDETWQLGKSEASQARIESLRPAGAGEDWDGKAALYGAHFGPLAEKVRAAGRTPGVWGDMFLDHPSALEFMPKETVIFDWQYFNGLEKTTPKFTERGFRVVGCPTLQNYNAIWMHLPQSEENVRQVARDVHTMGLEGVCVTTWENGLFGAYDTILPALRASGAMLSDPDGAPSFLDAYGEESAEHREWARLMGEELQSAGGTFAWSGIRSSLKTRLLLMSNPFLAWMHHADELTGEVGEKALLTIEAAYKVAPSDAEKGICLFARSSVEFVRLAEEARKLYAEGKIEAAIGKLAPTRQMFDDLAGVARRTHERIGGSLADIERCRIAREWVEKVIQRLRQYGDGSLGYVPAFEVITHPKFVPHDQASWWLINRWANQ